MPISRPALVAISMMCVPAVVACDKPKSYDTTIEILQIQKFGQDSKSPGVMDLEVKFSECPGDARRVVRADKAFGECADQKMKVGDKVSSTVKVTYNSERQSYRSEFLTIGGCPIQIDPKEIANYEMVQVCTELRSTGADVGVRCDRTRPKELIEKCPWLRRN